MQATGVPGLMGTLLPILIWTSADWFLQAWNPHIDVLLRQISDSKAETVE